MRYWQDFKALWNGHRKALIGVLCAAVVTLIFLVRVVFSAIYWHDPAHYHQTVQPWMTIGVPSRMIT